MSIRWTFFILLINLILAVSVIVLSKRGHDLNKEIHSLSREINSFELEQRQLLGELTYLGRPERILSLVKKYTNLKPVKSYDIISDNQLMLYLKGRGIKVLNKNKIEDDK